MYNWFWGDCSSFLDSRGFNSDRSWDRFLWASSGFYWSLGRSDCRDFILSLYSSWLTTSSSCYWSRSRWNRSSYCWSCRMCRTRQSSSSSCRSCYRSSSSDLRLGSTYCFCTMDILCWTAIMSVLNNLTIHISVANCQCFAGD